ncbi:uracil-DNA glycosylase [Methylocapsa sp. D3K7]|uniref:uracil-DNA glycosylase n=1 Tax=Methylocapsa sp. D3K7 TaxID=3041435 RepID=UPI00244EDBD6|nr:uracil-DNA glycosylase [Methylocapsa sp. D3K7]WGJ13331.1 uracil-DNA glycosylase [Methylocapsa sp. D3K7]
MAAPPPQMRLPFEPDPECGFCPRLVGFRNGLRTAQPGWHNAPVPFFGTIDAQLLVVGLAPGLNGANRTGRPFTGDFAGDLLYMTLIEYGFASGTYDARPDDGLRLVSSAITNAVRCVPPKNKPESSEINNCRLFLKRTIMAMPNLRAIVALGRIAHESVIRAYGLRLALLPFVHGSQYVLGKESAAAIGALARTKPVSLFDSYHCSRYNTNTGVLTKDMFRAVFAKVRERLADL